MARDVLPDVGLEHALNLLLLEAALDDQLVVAVDRPRGAQLGKDERHQMLGLSVQPVGGGEEEGDEWCVTKQPQTWSPAKYASLRGAARTNIKKEPSPRTQSPLAPHGETAQCEENKKEIVRPRNREIHCLQIAFSRSDRHANKRKM